MEDRVKTKASRLVKKPSVKAAVPTTQSKSLKCSPLEIKRKKATPTSANPILKLSNSKLSVQNKDSNVKLCPGGPQHRRAKSDPVPNSPSIYKKPSTAQVTKRASNPKSAKGHRRSNSETENFKKSTSENLIEVVQLEDRAEIIDKIKNSFLADIPLITTVDFYHIGKPLGKGAFGKVYLGIHKLSGLKVAIKTIEKSFMQDERTRKKVFQEVYIMNKIHDKNVIRLLELFESPKHLMIVLEYAGGGDLLQLLRNRGKLSESDARPIFKQIIDGVLACHNEEIIHRDIKLDNILLNEENTLIKLCDFGVSRVAKAGTKINEQCGTPAYLAPEIIVNEGYEPFFVDVWSMGILLYALLSATVPFKAKTIPELHKIVLRGKYEFPEEFSQNVRDFISQMLNPVPHLRIKLQELKNHIWFATDTLDSSFHSVREGPNPKRQSNLLKRVSEFGFPCEFTDRCLKKREINHATASYNLLDINLPE